MEMHFDVCFSCTVDPKFWKAVLDKSPATCKYCKRIIKENELCFAVGPDKDGNPGFIWCDKCNELKNTN
jgi:hypothetical protein